VEYYSVKFIWGDIVIGEYDIYMYIQIAVRTTAQATDLSTECRLSTQFTRGLSSWLQAVQNIHHAELPSVNQAVSLSLCLYSTVAQSHTGDGIIGSLKMQNGMKCVEMHVGRVIKFIQFPLKCVWLPQVFQRECYRESRKKEGILKKE
jgi:hypothetical protein